MSKKRNTRQFFKITDTNEEERLVYGYASTEGLDNQDDIVTREAIEEALPEYLRFSNIREMHTLSAVGVVVEHRLDEAGLYIGVKVIDSNAWEKVKAGVYKGFSIGGTVLEEHTEIIEGKTVNVITKMRLVEISLVDRPANPEALIELYKADNNNNIVNGIMKTVSEALNKLIKGGDTMPKEYEYKVFNKGMFTDQLKSYQRRAGYYPLLRVLEESLDQLWYNDDNLVDPVQEAEKILSEFNDKILVMYREAYSDTQKGEASKDINKADDPKEDPETDPETEPKDTNKADNSEGEDPKEDPETDPEENDPEDNSTEKNDPLGDLKKAGRTLSGKNAEELIDIRNRINDVLESAGVTGDDDTQKGDKPIKTKAEDPTPKNEDPEEDKLSKALEEIDRLKSLVIKGSGQGETGSSKGESGSIFKGLL